MFLRHFCSTSASSAKIPSPLSFGRTFAREHRYGGTTVSLWTSVSLPAASLGVQNIWDVFLESLRRTAHTGLQ